MDTRSMYNPSKNGPNDIRNSMTLSTKEPPACVQNAMMNREKKPFTYLPGGLDLSQIKSEKMARRLMINALSPGVQEKPRPPSFTPNPDTPPIKSSHYFNLPVAVFPCIQIPSNPKELLRRTSGPYNRSESIDNKPKENPEKKLNGNSTQNDIIKPIEKIEEIPQPIKEEIIEKPIIKDIDTYPFEQNNEIPIIKDIETYQFEQNNEIPIMKDIETHPIKEMNEISIIKDVETYPIDEINEIPNNYNIKSYSPIIHDITEFKNDDKLQIELPVPNYDPPQTYTPIIEDIKNDAIEDEIILPKSESITSISDDTQIAEEYLCEKEIEPNTPINEEAEEIEEMQIDTNELSIPNCDSSIKSITPTIDDSIIDESIPSSESEINEDIFSSPIPESMTTESTEESAVEESKSEVIEKSDPINCDIIIDAEEPVKSASPICSIESIIKDLNIEENIVKENKVEEEERVVSPMRRSTETIKGLTEDFDSFLPSLNICTKRFSFLRDSPTKEEEEIKEDPYSIITGIPPKISLIDKKINYEPVKPQEPIEVINNFIPKIEVKEVKAPSPFNKEEFWKTDLWNNPPKDSVSIKDFLNDDPEPAWKKEIREIAMRKAEAKEESVEYNVDKEPPWKRELRELTQAREAKLLNTNEITLKEPIYESPWGITNNTFYRPMNRSPEKSAFAKNPTWSQTLRPKTWKERNAETIQKPKEIETPDWKKTPSKHFMESFIKKQLSRSNSNSSDVVNKTPEITVEVVNQPSYTSFPSNTTNNGYVYPWESSSESSIAFSPEPRTPTPQSRNSPFTNGSNYSGYSGYSQNSNTVPREYGTLSFQPRRNPVRSCPIQSRSFKYLQLLTGTDDSYEDDEPFIPQPPQHAHPKPGNF